MPDATDRLLAPGASAPVVWRERELAAVVHVLTAPWPRLLLVEGLALIGKSTLVDAAVRHTAAGRAAPLVARATLAERDLPYAALASLLPDSTVEPTLTELAAPRRRALDAGAPAGDRPLLRLRRPDRPHRGRARVLVPLAESAPERLP